MLIRPDVSAQNELLINNKISLAKRYEQSGDLEKAKKIYNDIIKEQPWNFEIVKSLNDIFLKLKEYDNSILLIEEKIKLNPTDPNLYGLLGSTYATMGENQKASEIWDKAIEINKSSMVTYRVIADYAIQKRDFNKAIEILKKGLDATNEPMIFSYDLGNLYSITMEFEEAAKVYCDLLFSNPEQLASIQSRMNRYLTHANSVKATIDVTLDYYEKSRKTQYLDLLSYLYMREQNYSKALDLMIQKDKALDNNGISIFNFAKSVFAEGDFNTSSKAYMFLINNYKNSSFLPDAELGYIRSAEEKLNSEQIDSSNAWKPFLENDTAGSYKYSKIIKDYENLAEKYFNDNIIASAKMRIGIIKLTIFKDYNEAGKIFSDLQKSRLAPILIVQLMQNLAQISIQKNNLSEAQTIYNRLKEIPAFDPSVKSLANFMSAKILFWTGNFPKALIELKDISQNLSDNFANDAIELSIIINTMKQDSLNLLNYAKGDLLSAQNNFNGASEIFKKLADNKNLILLNDISKYKFAQMEIALNKYNSAISALEELSSGEIKNVYSDKALYLLGNTYLYALNNYEKGQEVFQNLLDTFPNSLYFDKSRQMLNIINKGIKQTI